MAALRSAPGSRLPVAKPRPTIPVSSQRGVSAPSKLEQLRQQVQYQIQKDKEEKLREMYFNNPPPSNRALIRLTSNTEQQEAGYGDVGGYRTGANNGGNVRDFFQQRRAFEQTNNNPNQARRKSNPAQGNGYSEMHKQRTASKPPVATGYKGMGRDKSKPLAPISRDNSHTSSSTMGSSKPMGKTYTLDKDGKVVPFNRKAVQNRNNPHSKNSDQNGNQPSESEPDSGRNDHSPQKPPAPSSGKKKSQNFREWQEEQKRKREALEKKEREEMEEQEQPKSDYQKWQQTMV